MPDRTSRTRFVPAPPEAIFDLLADPDKHALIDGSGTVRAKRSGPDRLHLGATFGVDMHHGLPYRMTNHVEEFEEGRRIAWRHFGRHRWRYELEPVEGGTQVTETFDTSHTPAPLRPIAKLMGRKNGESIDATLDRLVQHFSS
ncbi:MAG: SRPBCC family protein [Acidimicrobiales bacterium]|nr:SRPBCC family protein [Acidimicrobiales bacterium]